ncbi:MAG: hypothetical protein J2P22_17005 [Nocardioides sp.]|nr:hypothetical protein [Nocardioides sp.]
MTTTPSPSVLVPDDLLRLMELVRRSDSIELKLTVPASAYRPAAKALGIDPLTAQIRQVFFFDTPDLALNRTGVVVRARRIQGRDGDSTVKLRPIEPAEVSEKVRASRQFSIEVDAMPGGYVCSGSMKSVVGPAAVLASVNGERPVHKLFSKEQRHFYDAHAPEGLAMDDLSVLGPILVLKLKIPPAEFSRRLVVEMWIYPDGSRVVEVSTKCLPGQGLDVAREARRFLESRGIPVGGEQQTKTKTALEFFASELTESSA